MSGHCPGCGTYCEEDDSRLCGRCIDRAQAFGPELLRALRMLYTEQADYIRVNKLGDVHHNAGMKAARAVLTMVGGDSSTVLPTGASA